MRRRTLPAALVLTLAAVLCACSSGGSTTPSPSVSTTPPPVQRTVAAGATVHGESTAGATAHVMPDGQTMTGQSMTGQSMAGMSMPAPGAVVPNGTGSSEVAAPNVDGCNRAYGRTAQCIPTHAPGGGPITCSFLATYHYLPLLVTRDPLGLLTRGGVTARVIGGKRYITGCSA